MAQDTKIQWTNHTANLWHGCTKVHAGCDNCYAECLSKRWGNDVWGNDKPRKLIKSAFNDLDKFQKLAFAANEIHTVFVGSMMDIFEKSMPLIDSKGNDYSNVLTNDIRNTLFTGISLNYYPNLMFLFLTKRPSNINKMIPTNWLSNPPKNVMFGTSPVNQETADKLIPQLLKVKGHKFLSIEPQLGKISIKKFIGYIGGEYYICNNEKDYGHRESLSSSDKWRVGDNSKWRNMESSEKGMGYVEQNYTLKQMQEGEGRTQYRDLSNDSCDGKQCSIINRGSQVNLSPFQRRDTNRYDSESRGRHKDEQSSRQPNFNDSKRTVESCENDIKEGDKDSRWREKFNGKIDPTTSNRNSESEGERGEISQNSERLQHNISACVKIDEGATLAKDFWIIQGGESGHHRRPFDLKWAYAMKQECHDFGIPFFFKQIDKVIEKKSGIPIDLQIQQIPNYEEFIK